MRSEQGRAPPKELSCLPHRVAQQRLPGLPVGSDPATPPDGVPRARMGSGEGRVGREVRRGVYRTKRQLRPPHAIARPHRTGSREPGSGASSVSPPIKHHDYSGRRAIGVTSSVTRSSFESPNQTWLGPSIRRGIPDGGKSNDWARLRVCRLNSPGDPAASGDRRIEDADALHLPVSAAKPWRFSV